jgi:hypothetical protein
MHQVQWEKCCTVLLPYYTGRTRLDETNLFEMPRTRFLSGKACRPPYTTTVLYYRYYYAVQYVVVVDDLPRLQAIMAEIRSSPVLLGLFLSECENLAVQAVEAHKAIAC